MQNNSKLLCLITASLVAGTGAAPAQAWNGVRAGWNRSVPGSEPVQPRAYSPDVAAPYGVLNGTNHPAPGSTQGDVGPDGNNNGTLTGVYRR
jgi:hypothetical protein